jgi:hypothetical protein
MYPTVFGLEVNSSELTAAMDIARGGQFLSIPSPYPTAAWYHYDDESCDYECMAIEYLYWCIVSNMGILDDPSTCSGIANEWELCSPGLFQTIDTAMYAIITDTQYNIPQLAPDGNYCPSVGINGALEKNLVTFYPNPVSQELTLVLEKGMIIQILNVNGTIVHEGLFQPGETVIDLSEQPHGVYTLKLQTEKGTITRRLIKE